jgi:RHS repeat-associated protein
LHFSLQAWNRRYASGRRDGCRRQVHCRKNESAGQWRFVPVELLTSACHNAPVDESTMGYGLTDSGGRRQWRVGISSGVPPKRNPRPSPCTRKSVARRSRLQGLGARFYSPELGMWLSMDPIGEMGGVRLYGFAGNNAINRYDARGLTACNGSADVGSIDWQFDGYGFINSEAWGSARIYKLSGNLIDSINQAQIFKDWLGRFGAVARGAVQGLVGVVRQLVVNEAQNFAFSGYTDFIDAGSAAARQALLQVNANIMDNRQSGYFRGARMDVSFKWRACECQERRFLWWRWTAYDWSPQRVFKYKKCYFDVNSGLTDTLPANPLDRMELKEISDSHVSECLTRAFAEFQQEVQTSCSR